LPSSLKYAFLNDDPDSSVIISYKLSQEESLRLITILEKHRAAFGYSPQDLKGISPVLCTNRIPTDLDITLSREPQRRLNNAMREVVKKEILKQVVPKKGGMIVVKNDKNELIPQRIVTR
jgi:hypothetical protein